MASDVGDRSLTPDTAGLVVHALICSTPARIRSWHAFAGQGRRNSRGGELLKHLENSADHLEFALGSGQPGDMVAGHPDAFALDELADSGPVEPDQPATETVRRSAASREPTSGERDLGVNHLLRQVVSKLSGMIVVNQRDDHLADIGSVSLLMGCRDAIHEDHRHASFSESILQPDPIERIIGSGKAISPWYQDMRYSVVVIDFGH